MVSRTNFTEIAEKVGVSVATVSRAINGTGPVKESTRCRILKVAHEQGLWGHTGSRREAGGQLIGVILPDMFDYFFSNLLRGIDGEARRSGSRLLVAATHSAAGEVQGVLQGLSAAHVDGLIVLMPVLPDEVRSYLESLALPIVFLNPPGPLKGHSSIWIDDYQGAYAATEHLIEHGYKALGIITGPEGSLDSEERQRGFEDALTENGLMLRPELVAHQNFKREGGRHGFSRLMSQRVKPDAIFCCNDMMAIGAIEEAETMKISIPGDVALVGFDDVDVGGLIVPKLSTVHVPVCEIGGRALRHLLDTVVALPPDRLVINEKISTGLMIRESCGCKAAR